ncbi:uncharacterized protein LOC144097001 [Amblyomma americanum]
MKPATEDDTSSRGLQAMFTARSCGTSAQQRQNPLAGPRLDQVLEQLQREQKRDGRRVLVGFVVMALSIAFVILVVVARVLMDEAPENRRPPMPPAHARRADRYELPDNDSDVDAESRLIKTLLSNHTALR